MKKTLALVLAAVMLLSLLSACKSSADETPTVDPAETEQTTTPEETTPAEEQTPEEPQPSQEELDQAAADQLEHLTFLDLDQELVEAELEREKATRRSGPISENIQRHATQRANAARGI